MKTTQINLVPLCEAAPYALASYVRCEKFGRVWFEAVYFIPKEAYGAAYSSKIVSGKTIYAAKRELIALYNNYFS